MNPTSSIRHPVTVRPVRTSDAPAMRAFVEQLAPTTRRMRFHAALNECSAELLRVLTEPDGMQHVAFVALDRTRIDRPTIVGEARYVLSTDGDDSAEFAICVSDAMRGRGVADALMQQLYAAARAARIGALYGEVLAGNASMARFMRRHGFGPAWTTGAEASVQRWERAVCVPPAAPSGWIHGVGRWWAGRAGVAVGV